MPDIKWTFIIGVLDFFSIATKITSYNHISKCKIFNFSKLSSVTFIQD